MDDALWRVTGNIMKDDTKLGAGLKLALDFKACVAAICVSEKQV